MNSVPQNTTEAVQHEYNVGGLFVWAVGEDDKNSSQVKFIDKHKKSHFEKKLEYVMMVGFIKMISSISMCSSLIKEVSHFLQGSSTLTKYC